MFDDPRPRRSALIGVIALVVSLIAVVVSLNVHLGVPGADYTTVRFGFPELNNVRQTNQVNIDGVRIGQVREVTYEDGQAVVVAQVQPDLTFYRDATAVIENRSPLGQKILEVTTGTPEAGELGDEVLAMPAAAVTTELDTVLGALDEPSREALASAVRELGTGAAGHGEDIRDFLSTSPQLLADVGDIADALSDDELALVALLANAESLASRFEGRAGQIEAVLGNAATTLDAFAVDDGAPLEQALGDLPGTLDVAEPALRSLGAVSTDVTAALEEIDPGTRALGDGAADTRGLLREALTPLNRVPGVAEDAVPGLRSLRPTVVDMQPLAPRTARAILDGVGPAAELGPRHADVMEWFTRFADVLSYGDSNGNNGRVMPVLHPSAAGFGPLPELLGNGEGLTSCVDGYPAAGDPRTQDPGLIATEGCR